MSKSYNHILEVINYFIINHDKLLKFNISIKNIMYGFG